LFVFDPYDLLENSINIFPTGEEILLGNWVITKTGKCKNPPEEWSPYSIPPHFSQDSGEHRDIVRPGDGYGDIHLNRISLEIPYGVAGYLPDPGIPSHAAVGGQ
jgi:hypothetical protein